jgi:hypothetical protein
MIPSNDAKHIPPYYDNPCGVACWPCCEASAMFSKPGGHPDRQFAHPQNNMSWNLVGPGCFCMAPVAYCYYCSLWCISCCWCCTDLPCTEKPVTALFAKNYPDRLTSQPVERQPQKQKPEAAADLPPYSPPARVPSAPAAPPAEDEQHKQLRKYKQMLDDGLITEADYDAKKKEILFG